MTKINGFGDTNADRGTGSMLFEIDAPPELDAIVLPYEDDGIERPREICISLNGKATVRNVTKPTLSPVLPNLQTATGAAMIVAPGGDLWSDRWRMKAACRSLARPSRHRRFHPEIPARTDARTAR